jgi:adenylate kinase
LRAVRQSRSNSLGITGTPGTGKRSAAPLIASALDFRVIDLNAFALEAGCSETLPKGTDVDVVKLRRALLKTEIEGRVVFGHLLPDVFKGGELGFVAVIRCDPRVLKRRLLARGYRGRQLIENIEAELIGVSLSDSLETFGGRALGEYDSTSVTPSRLSRQIVGDFRRLSPRRTPWIDWTTSYDSAVKLRLLLSSESKDSAFT